MRQIHFHLLAMAMLMLAPCGRMLAAEPASGASENASTNISDRAENQTPAADAAPATGSAPAADAAGGADSYDANWIDNSGLTYEPVAPDNRLAVRMGVWGVQTRGSLTGVGEYFGLDPVSPFYDIDGLFTNGVQTFDFSLTGPENEANAARAKFYGPLLNADVEWDRFIHRLGHDPLSGWRLSPTPPGVPANNNNNAYWGEDQNIGEDNAIRVQTVDANFDGNLTENLKWKMNVWGISKKGQRQANGFAHCQYPAGNQNRYCHNICRGQQIDWMTAQIEPGLEARFDGITVEYTRTMRTFQQNDALMMNDYSGAGFSPLYPTTAPQTAAYAYVPENYTEIDRLKTRVELGAYTDLYVLGFLGNTHNKFTSVDNRFYGGDIRITDRSFDNLTLTPYAKSNAQTYEIQPAALNQLYPSQQLLWREGNSTGTLPSYIEAQPNYRRYAAGVTSRWEPFKDDIGWRGGMALISGYQWNEIARNNVTYQVGAAPYRLWTQPNTISNTVDVGVSEDWTRWFNTTVKYIWRNNTYPLTGVTPSVTAVEDTDTNGAVLNSALPTRENIVELAATWSPTDAFWVNGTMWIEDTYNHTGPANFEEDRYPFSVSTFYTPNQDWTVSVGYANFSDWINQDVTLGGAATGNSPSETQPWRYAGKADVFNLAVTRVLTSRLRANAGFEFTRGHNEIDSIPEYTYFGTVPPSGVSYGDLAYYTEELMNLYRWSAGVDYDLTTHLSSYVRYNYYDWDNPTSDRNSGTANMLLGGISGTF
jgi:hypothetical protein